MDKGKKPIRVEDDSAIERTTVLFLCQECRSAVGSCERIFGNYGIYRRDKFCRECGQKIDWSEEE